VDDRKPVEDGPSIELIRRLVRRLLPSALFKEKWSEAKYTDTQVPTYNAATGKFEPGTPSGTGAPTDADYLVGTANATLSAEIVVGTTPGGELGGTWASPTVDATHSGSAHHAAVTVSGTPDYITLSGQDIVRGSVDLAADVTGTLPIANGGTGQTTAQAAIDALTAVAGATNEHVLTKDTATGNAVFKAAAGGGGHAIEENGTPVTVRANLNFIDAGAGAGLLTDDTVDTTEVNLDLYVLNNAGRATPQVIIGGTADNAILKLYGTSSATHTTSTIDVMEHLNIATGKVIQYNGTAIMTPDATLGVKFAGSIGLMGTTAPTNGGAAISITPTLTLAAGATYNAIDLSPTYQWSDTASATVRALFGVVKVYLKGAATLGLLEGLNFQAQMVVDPAQVASGETATVTTAFALNPRLAWTMANPGDGRTIAVTNARTAIFQQPLISIFTPGTSTITITTFVGVDVIAWTQSTTGFTCTTAINLRVGDITGTSFTAANNRVVQFGTATPTTTKGLFEMMANFTAAANATPIWISEGATPTRRQLKTIVETGLDTAAGTKLICYLG
jgi:hypothetical protein